jgi:hypothetical protein
MPPKLNAASRRPACVVRRKALTVSIITRKRGNRLEEHRQQR